MENSSPTTHEQRFVTAFFCGRHKSRWIEVLRNASGRERFLDFLHHGTHALDMRFAEVIPNSWSTADIRDRLIALGSGQDCYVFSTMSELDQRSMPLHDAINAMLGSQMGSVASCKAG